MTVATDSAALLIRYTPSYAALRPLGPLLCGGAHVRTAACAARLRRGHVASPRLPYISGRVKAERGGSASSFQPPISILLAAFLMLGAVASAASANIVKSLSLLDDAGHSAAYIHGFLLGRSHLFLSKISSAVSTKGASRSAIAERLYTHYGGPPPSLTPPANGRSRRRNL
jgi:hypothetical protein